jgi:hypothetical protein
MGISKKIRFEIFKRDGFKCAYCGKAPPAVTLELDHIEPKAKGGKDDINNYLTACFDCNRGKRDIPLEKIPEQLQENLEILKEKELQLSEYRKFIAKIEKRLKGDFEEISGIYSEYYPGWEFSDQFKNVSLRRFLQLLPKHLVVESLRIAVSKWPNNKDKVIPYFCGICWNKIKGTER